MDHASNRIVSYLQRQAAQHGCWRNCLTLFLLCFALSTELLFSPATFEHWSPGQIFDGWLEQFLDTFLLGLFVMCMAASAHFLIDEDKRWRLIALIGTVIIAAGAGFSGLTWFHYPAGYYPPILVLLGEALRVMFLGVLLTLVWVVRKRNSRAGNRLRLLEITGAILNRRMLEAQLKVMEAQIEPHFLFNTLATVKCLYRTGAANGDTMLSSLRQYLGAALPKFRGEHATLESECALVEAYLDILQIRMGHRLQFAIDLPAGLAKHAFPPMMLITLVENAIKHGLASAAEGGRIEIVARATGATFDVKVIDNGIGFQSTGGSGIGLVNIRARLAALYGERARLILEQNLPRGVVACIVVPLDDPAGDSRCATGDTPHTAAASEAGDDPGAQPGPWQSRLRKRIPHILVVGVAMGAMDELRKLPIDLDIHSLLHTALHGAMIVFNSVLITFALIFSITLAEQTRLAGKWRPLVLALVVGLTAPLASMASVQISFLFDRLSGSDEYSDLLGLFFHMLWISLTIGCLSAAYFTASGRAQRSAARLWTAELQRMQAEKQVLESRLNVMKARVDPEFLIQQLGEIQSLYLHDARMAEPRLDNLISYLHACCAASGSTVAVSGDAHIAPGAQLGLS